MDQIIIGRPDNFHCHLRDQKTLGSFGRFRTVVGYTARQFGRGLVMPNVPSVVDADGALEYKRDIISVLPSGVDFEPLMTIKLVEGVTTPQMTRQAKKAGIIAAKAYPTKTTTGSEEGISNFNKMRPVFEAMEKEGMALSIHGEFADIDISCLNWERMFVSDILPEIVEDFPGLKITLEHITSEDTALRIEDFPETVAATITAHHLILTINDVVGDKISPHNFCKPIPKFSKDRDCLIRKAISGNPRFFFGSDSAPHLRSRKECGFGAAGVFSEPVALALLVQIFEEHGAIDNLEGFVSVFGANFYGLPLNEGRIKLVREEWVVPEEYDGIVPFMAGQKMAWQVL